MDGKWRARVLANERKKGGKGINPAQGGKNWGSEGD